MEVGSWQNPRPNSNESARHAVACREGLEVIRRVTRRTQDWKTFRRGPACRVGFLDDRRDTRRVEFQILHL